MNIENLKDEDYLNAHNIIMCTKKGVIKKTTLEAYSRPRTNGINAITISLSYVLSISNTTLMIISFALACVAHSIETSRGS